MVAMVCANGYRTSIAPVLVFRGSTTGLSVTDARWPLPMMNTTYAEAGETASQLASTVLR
jgi:hypothetical protein